MQSKSIHRDEGAVTRQREATASDGLVLRTGRYIDQLHIQPTCSRQEIGREQLVPKCSNPKNWNQFRKTGRSVYWHLPAGVLLAALLSFLPLRAAEHATNTAASRDPEGEALAHELISQRPAKPIDFNGVFHIRKPDGKRLDVPVLYAFQVHGDDWEGHYRSSATSAQGPEDLVVVHHADQPNQYIFTQVSLDGTRTNRMTLAGPEAAVSFAGSDFWLTDLGLDFLHWRQQHLIRDAKITMRLGRPCKVLESIIDGQGAYSRVVSWIDSEFGSLIYAEAYDHQNKRFKVFSLKGFKKIEGRWQVRELELRNDKTDSRTRLEFNFSPE